MCTYSISLSLSHAGLAKDAHQSLGNHPISSSWTRSPLVSCIASSITLLHFHLFSLLHATSHHLHSSLPSFLLLLSLPLTLSLSLSYHLSSSTILSSIFPPSLFLPSSLPPSYPLLPYSSTHAGWFLCRWCHSHSSSDFDASSILWIPTQNAEGSI